MKALTLWQPWATLVAMEVKRIETRCWATKYRGEIAIHSAAKLPPKWLGTSSQSHVFRDQLTDVFGVRRDRVDDIVRGLPYGKVLCVVCLTAIEEIDGELRDSISARERVFGNYGEGRYAWHLRMVEVFEPPIAAKGNRMLWNWNAEVPA
jgi:hypothetical protein